MRLDFEHYLVEYWDDSDGFTLWGWKLDTFTKSLPEAREALRRVVHGGKKARLVRVLEMAEADERIEV